MAIYTYKSEKISILSKPDSDESYIANVETTSAGNTYYDYVIYFVADLREVLNTGYLDARVTIRSSEKERYWALFGDGNNHDVLALLAMLYTKTEDNKSEMFAADRQGMITRTHLDLLKFINPQKLRNAYRLNDRQLFGIVETTEIVDPEELKKKGVSKLLAQRPAAIIDPEFVSLTNFNINYVNALRLGFDPGALMFPTDDESPADARKRGTFATENIKTSNRQLNNAMFTMRYQLQDGMAAGDQSKSFSTFTVPTTGPVAVSVKKVHREQMIPVKLRLKGSDIGRDFIVQIDVIDKKGLIGQTIMFPVDHRQNVEDYYAPRCDVDCGFSYSFDSHKKDLTFTVRKSDRNISMCDLYLRTIGELTPITTSGFRKVATVDFTKKKMKILDPVASKLIQTGERDVQVGSWTTIPIQIDSITEKAQFNIPHISGNISILRAIPISATGTEYGNFSSASVKKPGVWFPYHAAIYSANSQLGITLSITNMSTGVRAVVFERRNLSKKEKKFQKVVHMQKKDVNDPYFERDASEAVLTSRADRQISVIDYEVKNSHIYEYRAKMYFENGVVKPSAITTTIKRVSPMNFVQVIYDKAAFITKSSAILNQNSEQLDTPEVTPSGGQLVATFDLAYELHPTDTDKLQSALSSVGQDRLYAADIVSLKTTLSNCIFFNIHRYDCVTGRNDFLGLFPAGRFIDDGIQTTSAPGVGTRYWYIVSAVLVSPYAAANALRNKFYSAATQLANSAKQVSTLDNPMTYSNLQAQKLVAFSSTPQLAYKTTKVEKYFSKSSMVQGTVPTVDTDPLSEFPTGDAIRITINTGLHQAEVQNGTVSISGRAGPIIRWKTTSNSSPQVDFFVVLATKQGTRYVAGTCHAVVNGFFRFVDSHNRDFVGLIQYHVAPVYLSGTTGPAAFVGSINLIDTHEKYRRGA